MVSPAKNTRAEAAQAAQAAAESARYALLRRLAPSMRHHLVVNLQPIGMVYEILDRRLRAPEPNLADVHDGAQKINVYAKAALASCLDVVTWLAPDPGACTTAADGVREAQALVGTSFTFRGYALRNQVGEVPGEVDRGAFREVVTGALVALSDEHVPPAEITITARGGDALEIALALRSTDGDKGFTTAPPYRPLLWADVEALAHVNAVDLERDGTSLRIRLPWVRPAA